MSSGLKARLTPERGHTAYHQIESSRSSSSAYGGSVQISVPRYFHLFRKGNQADSQIIELYDRLSRTWVERQNLARYTRNGGDGANVITKAQAEAVIGTWSW